MHRVICWVVCLPLRPRLFLYLSLFVPLSLRCHCRYIFFLPLISQLLRRYSSICFRFFSMQSHTVRLIHFVEIRNSYIIYFFSFRALDLFTLLLLFASFRRSFHYTTFKVERTYTRPGLLIEHYIAHLSQWINLTWHASTSTSVSNRRELHHWLCALCAWNVTQVPAQRSAEKRKKREKKKEKRERNNTPAGVVHFHK